jgi:hypothetical protein
MKKVKTDIRKRDLLNIFNTVLDSYLVTSWVDTISIRVEGAQDQKSRLLQVLPPVMQKLAAEQHINNTDTNELTINDIWEDNLRLPLDWMDAQAADQYAIKIKKLAQNSAGLNNRLLTTLIEKGADKICYNGGKFFACRDHSEGNGVRCNNISSVDCPELKIKKPENPTVAEMREAIPKVIQHMLGFKNDEGETVNSDTKSFLVMVPFNMMGSTMSSIYGVISNPLAGSDCEQKFNVTGVANRLLTQPDSFFVFRSDAAKPFFIRQEELIIASATEGRIENNEQLYKFKRSCIAGYGYWQYACKATFATI